MLACNPGSNPGGGISTISSNPHNPNKYVVVDSCFKHIFQTIFNKNLLLNIIGH